MKIVGIRRGPCSCAGARQWRVALVGMVLCASNAAAESVTLTTTYPSPSGIYVEMITTSNTYLSKDGGVLNVGGLPGTTPSPSYVMQVNGGAQMIYQDFYNYDYNNGTGLRPPPPPFAGVASGTPPNGATPIGGRLFYDMTSDQFYYSSSQADPTDSSTWFKALATNNTPKVWFSAHVDSNWAGQYGFPALSRETLMFDLDSYSDKDSPTLPANGVGNMILMADNTVQSGQYAYDFTFDYSQLGDQAGDGPLYGYCQESDTNLYSEDLYDNDSLEPLVQIWYRYYYAGNWSNGVYAYSGRPTITMPGGRAQITGTMNLGRAVRYEFQILIARTTNAVHHVCTMLCGDVTSSYLNLYESSQMSTTVGNMNCSTNSGANTGLSGAQCWVPNALTTKTSTPGGVALYGRYVEPKYAGSGSVALNTVAPTYNAIQDISGSDSPNYSQVTYAVVNPGASGIKHCNNEYILDGTFTVSEVGF